MVGRISVVYNGGPHPDRDIEKFRAACLKRFPNATDIDLGVLYRQAILQYDTPWKDRIVCLLGQDIMTEDIERHHLWPYMGRQTQNRIKAHPHVGGAIISGDSVSERAASRMALLKHGMAGQVNRSVMVSPSGMQESYVFSRRTQWTQDIREDDWHLICQHPEFRKRMHVFEERGPLVVYQAYSSGHVAERNYAKTNDDVRHMVKEMSRSTHFLGADSPEG
jgi:hypothetical protein